MNSINTIYIGLNLDQCVSTTQSGKSQHSAVQLVSLLKNRIIEFLLEEQAWRCCSNGHKTVSDSQFSSSMSYLRSKLIPNRISQGTKCYQLQACKTLDREHYWTALLSSEPWAGLGEDPSPAAFVEWEEVFMKILKTVAKKKGCSCWGPGDFWVCSSTSWVFLRQRLSFDPFPPGGLIVNKHTVYHV